MFLDFALQGANNAGQVISATGNSTDYIDLGASTNLGGGEPLRFNLNVLCNSSTSGTIACNLVGADDTGFSTNKITIAAIPTSAVLVAATQYTFHGGIPSHQPKRYLRFEYTVGGTLNATVIPSIVKDDQTTYGT